MEKIDSIKDIKENLQTIFKDEVRLYSLKGIEKTAMLLGVIATFFIVLLFIILGIVFASIALASYLNTMLDHAYWGYLMVGGVDIILGILTVVVVKRTKVPLLTSLFVRILVNIFNIKEDEDK